MAADAAGNLLIADHGNDRIRVVAGSTGTFYGVPMTAGHIYPVAGGGTGHGLGNGGPATSAALSGPSGVAVDGAGNLVITDTGDNEIRVVAASTGTSYGQAMTAGDIYAVAGDGTGGFAGDGDGATGAKLAVPRDAAVDGAGNLLIADTGNGRVRVVAEHTGSYYGQAMTAGDIYTVAGRAAEGFAGDGGPGTNAELSDPYAVAADGASLLFADAGNGRVRQVAG